VYYQSHSDVIALVRGFVLRYKENETTSLFWNTLYMSVGKPEGERHALVGGEY
jgi:hypothetical protein